jgi:hypothetical protein
MNFSKETGTHVLVNKRSGFLKDDIFVPEEWWQLKQ